MQVRHRPLRRDPAVVVGGLAAAFVVLVALIGGVAFDLDGLGRLALASTIFALTWAVPIVVVRLLYRGVRRWWRSRRG